MRPRALQTGFGLSELVVATAAAVLLIGAVSGSVVAAQRLEGRSQRTGSAVAAAATLWEQLRSLPFSGTSADTLTGRVFPHADEALNDAASWFSVQARDGFPPGTFVSSMVQNGVALRVAAAFCVVATDGWTTLPPDRLSRYSPSSPPAGGLLVRIQAEEDGTDLIVGVLAGAPDGTGGPQ